VLFPIRDHNPRVRFPVATVVLIAANALVFLFELMLHPHVQRLLLQTAGAIPYEIVHHVDIGPHDLLPWPATLWTAMFLHGGWMHLIGNMWFLWLFGDNVEEALGPVRFLLFYFVVGTVGALSQCWSLPSSTAPMIGASGAVAGVLGGYVMLYPRSRVETFVAIPFFWNFVDLPAWIFLGIWFVMQFFTGSGVAWMAHVGGFLAGVGAVRLLMPPPRRAPIQAEYIPPPARRWP
jgi:membrane associated rhomboid family serine protease